MQRFPSRLLPWIGAWFLIVAGGAGPADELLKLTPPQAAATLAVESLRDRTRSIIASPLFANLQKTSMVQRWITSPWFRNLRRSAEQVERGLGVPLRTIRDQIIGDAAVFAYFPGRASAPRESRGLLLLKDQDRNLIETVFNGVNRDKIQAGKLLRVERRTRGTIDYAVRIYRPGTRPDECYAHLDGSTFAWSNSEALLQAAIDLKLAGGPSLADNDAFIKVRRGLPENALASLYVAPAMVERLKAFSPPAANLLEKAAGLAVQHYAGAVDYMGVGVESGDGLSLHIHEALDLSKLDASIRNWFGRPPLPSPFPSQVPASAMAVAAVNVDLAALEEVVSGRLGKSDLLRLANAREVLQGLLLGVDPIKELFPRLNRGFLAFVDTQPQADRRLLFPIVAVAGWSEAPALLPILSRPIDFALRTWFAFHALSLDDQPNMAELRVETLEGPEPKVTALTNGWRNIMAYRVVNDRLVIGNSADSVRRFGADQPPAILEGVRSRHFPNAETFAVVDVNRLVQEVGKNRAPIAQQLAAGSNRDVPAIDRDLDHLLNLGGLFRAVGFASEVSAGGSEVHRKFLFLAR